MAYGGGLVLPYGGAPNFGSATFAPIAAIAATPRGNGYWVVGPQGRVEGLGSASPYFGPAPSGRVVSITSGPAGRGYWLLDVHGRIQAYGDATLYGEPPAQRTPFVQITATVDERGYWVLNATGQVYAFGDAKNFGWAKANASFRSLVHTADGKGYWEASRSGRLWAFGDAAGVATTNVPGFVSLLPTAGGGVTEMSSSGRFYPLLANTYNHNRQPRTTTTTKPPSTTRPPGGSTAPTTSTTALPTKTTTTSVGSTTSSSQAPTTSTTQATTTSVPPVTTTPGTTAPPAAPATTAPPITTQLQPPPVPASGAYLGEYAQLPGEGGDLTSIAYREQELGRTFAIDNHYYDWDVAFPTAADATDEAAGRIPMITWWGVPLDEITDGSQDALITADATATKNFGYPLFIRWGAEMNGDWYSWSGSENGDDPAAYIAAYQHIHNIFTEVGATNVAWVWAPNADSNPGGTSPTSWNNWENYYPGNAYVDWVGIDGYNWGPTSSGDVWQSFADIMDPIYEDYASVKPIMIAETSSVETGGSKAAWITDAGAWIQGHPDIKALCWFDTNESSTGIDWRVDSSASSYAAFLALASEPYFSDMAGSASS